MNFWTDFKKPFFVLAPMEDVTDAAFRYMLAKYSKREGGKYITFTEFVSADGLVLADKKGKEKLLSKLRFSDIERPIVAQIFGAIPRNIERTSAIVRGLGFDGIDINMGCPDKSVEKQGAGAALIKNPELAQEIIYAAKAGAGDLPVSVKTRIGYNENQLNEWLPTLLETKPAAITLHARTRKELSKVPAHWDLIKEAVTIRDAFSNSAESENAKRIKDKQNVKNNHKTLIVGNGDVSGILDARKRAAKSYADGVMVGRGVFGNPWAMSEYTPTLIEKLEVLIEHTNLFENEFAKIKSFATMRKHFSSYVEGFNGAKELRIKLMQCDNTNDVKVLLNSKIAQILKVQ